MNDKPLKHAVSLVIKNEESKFLVVMRPNDPGDALAGVWGFPAVSCTDAESDLEAAKRVGATKLGVEVEIGKKINDSTHDRGNFILHLTDFEATIKSGEPKVPQADTSITQYDEYKFTDDPTILFEAARKGSQCTQIFLESIGADWR